MTIRIQPIPENAGSLSVYVTTLYRGLYMSTSQNLSVLLRVEAKLRLSLPPPKA